MSSNFEMNKQEGNPQTSLAYPPNPSGPPGNVPYPPGNVHNPAYTTNPVPTYSNAPYYGSQLQTGVIMTTHANVLVVPQPAYKDYLAWSIVNMIFFNLILGIVALIFSLKTQDAVRCKDATSAASYSRTAFAWNVAALVVGIICHICWIVALIILTSVRINYGVSYYYGYNG